MRIIDGALRAAVEADGRTRYRLAKDSGVLQSSLSRWWSGERELSVDAAEKLMGVLGLEVVKAKTPASRRKAR